MSLFTSDKVEWSTYVYAPRYYDAYLISGECFWYYREDQRDGLGFWANPGGGWRSTGVMSSGGSPSKPVKLPLGVQVTWLSHTEKKYYQARITLPREKILELFDEEYKTDFALKGNTSKLNTIAIALAPGGFFSIRLGGGRTIEVATGQAQPIDVTWRFFAATHHFNGDKLKLYSIERSENPLELQKIFDNLLPQVKALDAAKKKQALTGSIRNDHVDEQPRIDIIGDVKLKNTLYNRYLHWGSAMAKEGFASVMPVNIAQIDNAHNIFYRTIVSG